MENKDTGSCWAFTYNNKGHYIDSVANNDHKESKVKPSLTYEKYSRLQISIQNGVESSFLQFPLKSTLSL